MTFTQHSMLEILDVIETKLTNNSSIKFKVINPDLYEGYYSGKSIEVDDVSYIYRSLKSWFDLAEILECRVSVPRVVESNLIELTFTKLSPNSSFHNNKVKNIEEKYGVESDFFNIEKMEEPAFMFYYRQALDNVKIFERKNILNLGVNRADEFSLIKNINKEAFNKLNLVGIDHSTTALEYAKSLFPNTNTQFYNIDLNNIDNLNLGRFDLLISIGTLQSPSINFKPYLMKLVQNYLNKDSALILGFPNSRWIDGEMIYGAKAPNYAMSEMSLLFNDVIFAKKYLQQHKYRVTITGKHYIFLTATKVKSTIS